MRKSDVLCANQRTDGHEFMKKISYLPINRLRMPGILAAAFLVLAGCQEHTAPAQPVPRVSYMLAQSASVPLVTELPGRVSAYTMSEVRPQITGVIQKRFFEEGADVAKDQQLYQIDPALFKAAYDRALADLANARANMRSAQLLAERYSKIVDINAVSRQEYDNAVAAHDQATAAVESARQALETARINLEYTKVLSPIAGRISRSFFTPGALVTQNQAQPLATVQQLSPVYVDVTQSSTEILKLRRALARGDIQAGANKGANVRLLLEDGTPYTGLTGEGPNQDPPVIMGELQFSDVTVDQSAGVVSVRATFENPDYVLLPGMYVRAVIEEGIREGAILIPQSALMRDQKNMPMVYVLTKELPAGPQAAAGAGQTAGAAARPLGEGEYYVGVRPVTVDRDYRNHWIVTAGLKPGDMLMTAGFQVARPGQVVIGELAQPESPLAAPSVPAKAVLSEKADGPEVVEPVAAQPARDEEEVKNSPAEPVSEEKAPQAAAPATNVPATAAATPAAVGDVSDKAQKEEKTRKEAPAPSGKARDVSASSAAAGAVSDKPEKEEEPRQKAPVRVQEASAGSPAAAAANGVSAVRKSGAGQPYKEQASVKEKAE